MNIMTTLSSTFRIRLINILRPRYPRQDQFNGFGMARFFSVPSYRNTEAREKGFFQFSMGNGGMMTIGSAFAFGGVGYAAYKLFTPEEACCAEKDDGKCKQGCDDSACLHKMDKEEQLITKANQDLEKALKEIKPKAMEATETALKTYCEASDLIKQFLDKAYCAIEEENLESPRFEEVWCEVYDLAMKRCEKVKEATAKGQCAWELLCKLRETIEAGKACKYTSCNPLLITAEEALLCAEREILNAKAKMDCIQSESRLVEQYRNLVEDFRRDLKAEMESMLTSNPECRTNLTENECNMVLTHAYKKILRVQKELKLVQEEKKNEKEGGGAQAEC